MNVINVTDETFVQATATGVTLTNFHADWCGSCQMMTPVLEQLATPTELGDQVKFTSIDTDHNPRTAGYFGIHSVPTILIKKDGRVVNIIVGVRSLSRLRAELKRVLK